MIGLHDNDGEEAALQLFNVRRSCVGNMAETGTAEAALGFSAADGVAVFGTITPSSTAVASRLVCDRSVCRTR